MKGLATTYFLLICAIGLTLWAVIANRLDPTLSTAMTVPIANLGSVVVALVATLIAALCHHRTNGSKTTRNAVAVCIAVWVILLLLLPVSNLGYLSRVG
jgi:amino acid permease